MSFTQKSVLLITLGSILTIVALVIYIQAVAFDAPISYKDMQQAYEDIISSETQEMEIEMARIVNQAHMLSFKGQNKAAAELYQKVIGLYPNKVFVIDLYRNLGYCYRKQNRSPEKIWRSGIRAGEQLISTKRNEPWIGQVCSFVAEMYVELEKPTEKDLQRTEELYRKVLETKEIPQLMQRHLHFRMVQVFAKAERYSETFKWYDRLKNTDDASRLNADLVVAEVYEKTDQKEKAIAIYQRIINLAKSEPHWRVFGEGAEKKLSELRQKAR